MPHKLSIKATTTPVFLTMTYFCLKAYILPQVVNSFSFKSLPSFIIHLPVVIHPNPLHASLVRKGKKKEEEVKNEVIELGVR